MRRVERALIGEYRELVDARARGAAARDARDGRARSPALPDMVRGYEDIKLRNVERYRAEAERLERELRGGGARRRPLELPVVQA